VIAANLVEANATVVAIADHVSVRRGSHTYTPTVELVLTSGERVQVVLDSEPEATAVTVGETFPVSYSERVPSAAVLTERRHDHTVLHSWRWVVLAAGAVTAAGGGWMAWDLRARR
jgi:hypothetical protein